MSCTAAARAWASRSARRSASCFYSSGRGPDRGAGGLGSAQLRCSSQCVSYLNHKKTQLGQARKYCIQRRNENCHESASESLPSPPRSRAEVGVRDLIPALVRTGLDFCRPGDQCGQSFFHTAGVRLFQRAAGVSWHCQRAMKRDNERILSGMLGLA